MEKNQIETAIRPARPRDLEPVKTLLISSGLPPDGIEDHLSSMVIAEREGEIIATAALEIYGESALLRSVAVDAREQGTGLGRKITAEAIGVARHLNVIRVFLLTETAREFFPKFGFRIVDRAAIPDLVKSSLEFTTLCPDSALAMELKL